MIKHGWLSMIATRGYNTPECFMFLGVKFSDSPNGLAAVNKVPGFGWMQIIFIADVIVGKFVQAGLAGLHLSHAKSIWLEGHHIL